MFWNIQSHPTPRLYEGKRKGKVFLTFLTTALYNFAAGVLHTVVVPTGTFLISSGKSSYNFASGVLHTVVVPTGTFLNNSKASFNFNSGALTNVVLPTGTFVYPVKANYAIGNCSLI
jgi:hypothetical protein